MKKISIKIIALFLGLFILKSCQNEEGKTTKSTQETAGQQEQTSGKNYMQSGKELALQTQAALGQNLSNAIAAHGYVGAVEFCNTKAIPITDSVSMALHANIKRVSDKPRNPANQAKEGELFYIDMCKQNLENGKELKPFISEDDKKMIGYYPIVTNSMCLNCHGTTDNIKAETLAKINSLYPKDNATGYKENEVRGIFVVEMDK